MKKKNSKNAGGKLKEKEIKKIVNAIVEVYDYKKAITDRFTGIDNANIDIQNGNTCGE